METSHNTTREDFMAFFRDTEKLNELTPMTALKFSELFYWEVPILQKSFSMKF